jgi:hypothetical protein
MLEKQCRERNHTHKLAITRTSCCFCRSWILGHPTRLLSHRLGQSATEAPTQSDMSKVSPPDAMAPKPVAIKVSVVKLMDASVTVTLAKATDWTQSARAVVTNPVHWISMRTVSLAKMAFKSGKAQHEMEIGGMVVQEGRHFKESQQGSRNHTAAETGRDASGFFLMSPFHCKQRIPNPMGWANDKASGRHPQLPKWRASDVCGIKGCFHTRSMDSLNFANKKPLSDNKAEGQGCSLQQARKSRKRNSRQLSSLIKKKGHWSGPVPPEWTLTRPAFLAT